MPPGFPTQYRGPVLGIPPPPSGISPTGLSPSTAPLSRGLRLSRVGLNGGPTTPHPHLLVASGFGLGCAVFARRYSRHPVWFLFLRVLRCFNSPRSRSLPGAPEGRIPIRGSRVQRLPAPTPGLSQLATPFLGSRAEPSTRRHIALPLHGSSHMSASHHTRKGRLRMLILR